VPKKPTLRWSARRFGVLALAALLTPRSIRGIVMSAVLRTLEFALADGEQICDRFHGHVETLRNEFVVGSERSQA
jgi:hypothetical protein